MLSDISSSSITEPDISLIVFNRAWRCHKDILRQSIYFDSLLFGHFRESKLKEIELRLDDELINENSFKMLIDIMYHREVNLTPDDIFNLVATSRFFQTDIVTEYCEKRIIELIKATNCIDIYYFADRYTLITTKENAFQWMLLRIFPVKCWDQLNHLTIELTEELIKDPRLVTPSEMYLYHVLKNMLQIHLTGTIVPNNEIFYEKIRNNPNAFLETKDGAAFKSAFSALRIGNIIICKENAETLIRDNIIPRQNIDYWIYKNWMSLVSIESPENFGPTSELITIDEFEKNAMRYAKIITGPDYHSWKFIGFSYGFDLALFFDGRTLIVKRVHQINEHKLSHSHLLRRIMIRWEIAEMNSINCVRQEDIQTITMTANEELTLKQLKKEPKYPCRISVEVLFHVPYKLKESDRYHKQQFEEHSKSEDNSSIPSKVFKSYKRFFK